MTLHEWMSIVVETLKVLSWPVVAIWGMIIFNEPIKSLLERLRKADLPGGISIEAVPKEIEKAETAKALVENEPERKRQGANPMPANDANKRMMELGLRPSPSGLDLDYYRNLNDQDPRLAMAALRIDLELMVKNLVVGFGLVIDQKTSSEVMIRFLLGAGKITSNQYNLISSILNVCNYAIHGGMISKEQAIQVLNIAPVLIDDYKAWLTWGFEKISSHKP